jgi:hypothetical protein
MKLSVSSYCYLVNDKEENMFVKLILISVFLVAIVVAAMGIKLLFNKDAEFKHSCSGSSCQCDEQVEKSCDQ